MSYREFNDRDGRLWEVWEVRPAVIERRQADDRRHQPRDFADRRSAELQFKLLGGLRDGWLTFQCGIERRRLTPIPEGWTSLPDDTLRALSARATLVNRAGLSSRVTGFGLTPKNNKAVSDKNDDESA
ncbi:MAG TPA: hypothetical protein VGM82_10805 [Gemmatimonadaceae bacterium]|jgi:hypothetical protein